MSDLPIIRLFRLHQLKTHPRNMRRFYPPRQVAEMAASLKACGGNKIAMQVAPADEPGTYFVVDGNLRESGVEVQRVVCGQPIHALPHAVAKAVTSETDGGSKINAVSEGEGSASATCGGPAKSFDRLTH